MNKIDNLSLKMAIIPKGDILNKCPFCKGNILYLINEGPDGSGYHIELTCENCETSSIILSIKETVHDPSMIKEKKIEMKEQWNLLTVTYYN